MTTRVAVVRAQKDYSDVDRAVREAVDLLGGLGSHIQPGQTVLVKPNLLNSKNGESGTTTDYRVTAVLVKMAREQGFEVTVGDSSGIRFHGASERVIRETGTWQACEAAGANVVSFDSTPSRRVEIPGARVLKACYIAEPALEADAIITVPKFKSHALTKFTGAVKNQLGCLPGGQKTIAHRLGSTPERFAQLLVDLYTLIRPRFAVMDAIVGIGGLWRPTDRLTPGLIIAGDDPVAVDAVAAGIGGYDPGKIPTLRIAAERGLGIACLERIKVIGDNIEALEPVPLMSKRMPPNLLGHLFSTLSRLLISKQDPKIHPEKCTGCSLCRNVCPVEAISLDNGCPVFDLGKCIRCFCCHELCPHQAVGLDWGFLGNRVMGRVPSPKPAASRTA